MNVHVILGTISKKLRIVTAESKKPFLIMEIVDKADPNKLRKTNGTSCDTESWKNFTRS